MTAGASSPALDARVVVTTAPTAGAVAILQIDGPDVRTVLARLTGRKSWTVGRAVLVDMAGIDEGLAILWREDGAQLMPHGGPRVVQRLVAWLAGHGVTAQDPTQVDPARLFLEAASPIEADMLAMLARAASPASVDHLLAQPALWREAAASPDGIDWGRVDRQSVIWARLVTPPVVAVVGRPNVGKSTLTNAMLGRGASLVADMPGTTRDWVAGTAQIQGVAVRWLDTPGIRRSDDLIEQQAIAMAGQVIGQADVVVAMRDPQTPWLDEPLTRTADVWVMNKVDDLAAMATDNAGGQDRDDPLRISAQHGLSLDALGRAILRRLGLPADMDGGEGAAAPGLWAFSPTLQACVHERDMAKLRAYLAP